MHHASSTGHRGWRSRGYLPHCEEAGLVQHIVFGLADALPRKVFASAMHAERCLDEGLGECLLAEPSCAEAVQNAILHADGERYRLIAWCVMPNHVHVVAEFDRGFALDVVVQGWKSTAAHQINKNLNRKGRLWRREYFDRFMRDDAHLETSIEYVESNPVTAKLVQMAADWRWSSAHFRYAEIAGEDAGGPR
jgi:putative transposase